MADQQHRQAAVAAASDRASPASRAPGAGRAPRSVRRRSTASGPPDSARARPTRWRWPPDSWCGYRRRQASGSGSSQFVRTGVALRRRRHRRRGRAGRAGFRRSCAPTRRSGCRLASGSCGIQARRAAAQGAVCGRAECDRRGHRIASRRARRGRRAAGRAAPARSGSCRCRFHRRAPCSRPRLSRSPAGPPGARVRRASRISSPETRKRSAHATASRGTRRTSSQSRRPSPRNWNAGQRRHQEAGREQQRPRRAVEFLAAFVQQRAPARRRFVDDRPRKPRKLSTRIACGRIRPRYTNASGIRFGSRCQRSTLRETSRRPRAPPARTAPRAGARLSARITRARSIQT